MERPTANEEIAVYQAQRSHELELNRATAAFEHALVSPLFILNGGATVAFLTLLGATSGDNSAVELRREFVVGAVFAWTVGLVIGALAVRSGYLAQRAFSRAVRLRREMFEQGLLRESPLRLRLKHPSTDDAKKYLEDTNRDIRVEREKAEVYQGRGRVASWFALALFFVGVASAAASLIVE